MITDFSFFLRGLYYHGFRGVNAIESQEKDSHAHMTNQNQLRRESQNVNLRVVNKITLIIIFLFC